MFTYTELMSQISDDLELPENNVFISVSENMPELNPKIRESAMLYISQYVKFFEAISQQLIDKNAIGRSPDVFVEEVTILTQNTMKEFIKMP